MIHAFCGNAPEWLKTAFEAQDVKLHEVGCCSALSAPVQHHIDMMLLKFPNDRKMGSKLFFARESQFAQEFVCEKLSELNCAETVRTICISKNLGTSYPDDVPLNVALVGNYLICNPKYTASEVIESARKREIEIISTNQGYSKCSVCVVSDSAIITEDESIYKACKNKLKVLLIRKGKVRLPGYDYGFIGGASAYINGTVYFFGNIRAHSDFHLIDHFVSENGASIVSLSDSQPLTDIGGIVV